MLSISNQLRWGERWLTGVDRSAARQESQTRNRRFGDETAVKVGSLGDYEIFRNLCLIHLLRAGSW